MVDAAAVEGRAVGGAAEFPALTRLTRVLLVVTVLMGLACLVAAAALLPSGSSAAFASGYPALIGLLGQLVIAALLRSLRWRAAATQRLAPVPPLARATWWPCVGLGVGSMLLSAATWLVAGPSWRPAQRAPPGDRGGRDREGSGRGRLGSAVLAAVLRCWLHERGRGLPAPSEGARMEDGTTQQSWDAVSPPPPTRDGLAGRLVALGPWPAPHC